MLQLFHSKTDNKTQGINRQVFKRYVNKVFKWRGTWSNRDVFYQRTHLLKQKIVNHYSQEFSLPIITPILNSDNVLFLNKEPQNHLITYDIVKHLEYYKEICNENQIKTKKYFQVKGTLWNKTFIRMINDNLKTKEFVNDEENHKENSIHKLIFRQSTNYDNKNNNEDDNLHFSVCLVNRIYHIRGFLSFQNKTLYFLSSNEYNKYDSFIDKNFFKFSNKCFGSLHKHNIFDYSIPKKLSISLNKITYLFLKNFCCLEC